MLEGTCSVLAGGLSARALGAPCELGVNAAGLWWVPVGGLGTWGLCWVLGSLHLTALLPRDSVDLRLEELKPFVPPAWMTEKMQKHMETLRRGGDVLPPEGPPEP